MHYSRDGNASVNIYTTDSNADDPYQRIAELEQRIAELVRHAGIEQKPQYVQLQCDWDCSRCPYTACLRHVVTMYSGAG